MNNNIQHVFIHALKNIMYLVIYISEAPKLMKKKFSAVKLLKSLMSFTTIIKTKI